MNITDHVFEKTKIAGQSRCVAYTLTLICTSALAHYDTAGAGASITLLTKKKVRIQPCQLFAHDGNNILFTIQDFCGYDF